METEKIHTYKDNPRYVYDPLKRLYLSTRALGKDDLERTASAQGINLAYDHNDYLVVNSPDNSVGLAGILRLIEQSPLPRGFDQNKNKRRLLTPEEYKVFNYWAEDYNMTLEQSFLSDLQLVHDPENGLFYVDFSGHGVVEEIDDNSDIPLRVIAHDVIEEKD